MQSSESDSIRSETPEKPAHSVYILLDAGQFPSIWRVLEYRFRRLPWISLCNHPGEAEYGPVLIQVSHDQTVTLAWFLEHTQKLHCLSWIVSPQGLVSLREHLRSLMHVETHDGSECGVRYYDTRILPAWYKMLQPEQEAHALGPINSWTYMDRDSMPCTLFGHGSHIAPEPKTLKLTNDQEAILLEATLPDLVLEQLEQSGNPDLTAMSPDKRYQFILKQIDKAKNQYGLLSLDELTMFCSLALGIGEDFDTQPAADSLGQYGDGLASREQNTMHHPNYS